MRNVARFLVFAGYENCVHDLKLEYFGVGISVVWIRQTSVTFGVAVSLLLAGCAKSSPAPVERVQLRVATSAEVLRAVRESGAKLLLVNMWATWCGPCREEFPDIVRLQRDYRARGLKVMFVSWDADPEVARRFLASQGIDYPSFVKSDAERDPQFINAFDPRWSGAFPATFLYDGRGRLQDFWEGKQTYKILEQKLADALSKQTDRRMP
jgi:thiol-disulfide isomerase/thioredoxin